MDSANNNADLSTMKEKSVLNKKLLPAMFFLSKIKSIISERITLAIRIYDTGFVSLFIVLSKLNKSTDKRNDAIRGSPGINQASFKNISINQAFFYKQP